MAEQTTTEAPFGGYTLTHIRHAGGYETPRFEAVLRLDGEGIADVSNSGTGGMHEIRWYAPGREAAQAFDAMAANLGDIGYWTAEFDADTVISYLLTAADFNRVRDAIVQMDDENTFETGCYTAIPRRTGETREAHDARARTMLANPDYRARNPHIWNRATLMFERIN